MVIQNDNTKSTIYRGYPVKNWFKYLGVRLYYYLNLATILVMTRQMLDVYLKRNKWLLEEYFSPKSLIQLCEYFQCSRLAYEICVFLDDADVMKKLESIKMLFLRSILGFEHDVSSNRLRMAINLPKMTFELFIRLKRVIDKYKEHL